MGRLKFIKRVIKLILYDICSAYVDYFITNILHKYIEKNQNVVLDIKFGNGFGKRKILCLFASYDKDSLIDDYVVHYLDYLNSCNMDIVFISNSKNLNKQDIDKIKPFVKRIVLRKGRGRDFGSWFIGLRLMEKYIPRYEHIILANDSVYGPLCNKAKWKIMLYELKKHDWGGFTDSYEGGYHVQSYFLFFSKKVFLSNAFKEFWQKYRFFNNKTLVIKKYEIGLSRLLIKNKFYPFILFPYEKIYNQHITIHPEFTLNTVNPTHFFWSTLLRSGYPFIKVELLRDNPSEIPNIYTYTSLIDNEVFIEMIRKHIMRVKRK